MVKKADSRYYAAISRLELFIKFAWVQFKVGYLVFFKTRRVGLYTFASSKYSLLQYSDR